MSSIVQNMMQRSLGDGARATKFEMFFQFSNPDSGPNNEDFIAQVKATSTPSKSHQIIDFKYKGRSIPIKGQTKFGQTWECTFYLTEDHKLKQAFETWIEALDQKHNYMDVTTVADVSETQRIHSAGSYTTDIKLYQLNFDGDDTTAMYNMYNVYPIEISPVQYSYDAVGQVQEFTVTFAYSYYTLSALRGREGNFIDTLVGKFQDASKAIVDGALTNLAEGINGFVSDAIGDSLGKLNNWAGGLSSDVTPPKTDALMRDLTKGGVPTKYSPNSIFSEAAKSSSNSANGFGTAVEQALKDANELNTF